VDDQRSPEGEDPSQDSSSGPARYPNFVAYGASPPSPPPPGSNSPYPAASP